MLIKINEIDYDLKIFSQETIPTYFGECNRVKKEILIAETANKQTLLKTIMHEITHAFLEETAYKYCTSKDSNEEEYMCEVTASVCLIYNANKEKIDKFINSVKGKE